MIARFNGRCAICDGKIAKGQQIVASGPRGGIQGRYEHVSREDCREAYRATQACWTAEAVRDGSLTAEQRERILARDDAAVKFPDEVVPAAR